METATTQAIDFRGILTPEHRKRYIFAGDATFTLVNPVTGARFTYNVTRSKVNPAFPDKPPVYFASVLIGPDNWTNYRYAGLISPSGDFKTTTKSKITATAPSIIALTWFLSHMEDSRIECFHEGKCGVCGRKLTVPESIVAGIGPICAEKGF